MANKKNHGFTLIELLVVIAVIALLMSILMPALSRVRQSAKITICGVNTKQIGTYVSLYQAENKEAVPVMLNRFDATATVPARARLLSLAFAAYSPETADLAGVEDGKFDPNRSWGWNTDRRTLGEYFSRYLPDFYVCPFVRGRDTQVEFEDAGTITLTGPAGTQTYRSLDRKMAGESYSVWRWERRRGSTGDPTTILTANHPYGFPHGAPKYGALSWNNYGDLMTTDWATLDRTPVKWTGRQLRRIGAGALANATIVYCEQGQNDSHSTGSNAHNGIYNYGSHKKGSSGGTNVLMGDTHVEWVEGTQVGWP
ncbi:MAG: type II secretion system GspH family protein [Planctomycetaceae bacterium]|nr:type II secretion system GspH family protein [Planctomycetaceae bacterium]